jgi:hypothetical protein
MTKKRIPKLHSREAVAAFFESHDSADYVAAATEPLELDSELAERIRAKPRLRQVTLRLNEWMIQTAKDYAPALGLPYQGLIRVWIATGMRRSLGETVPLRKTKRVRRAGKVGSRRRSIRVR